MLRLAVVLAVASVAAAVREEVSYTLNFSKPGNSTYELKGFEGAQTVYSQDPSVWELHGDLDLYYGWLLVCEGTSQSYSKNQSLCFYTFCQAHSLTCPFPVKRWYFLNVVTYSSPSNTNAASYVAYTVSGTFCDTKCPPRPTPPPTPSPWPPLPSPSSGGSGVWVPIVIGLVVAAAVVVAVGVLVKRRSAALLEGETLPIVNSNA